MNPKHADAEVDAIARELEQYIAVHPTAADTAEGISRWWLERREPPMLSSVEDALQRLVARGVLTCRPLPDGNSLFARAARSTPATD